MSDNPNAAPQAAPIPSDDPQRNLTLARPDEDQRLPHIGMVGDTYTLIDMHVPPAAAPRPTRTTSRRCSPSLTGK